MKKTYTLLFMLLGLLLSWTSPVQAQDDELIEFAINSKTGDWTASGSPSWANEWATTNKEITIRHSKGNNNMAFWDAAKLNIQFYSSVGGSTTNEDYYIIPSKDYYVAEVSLDFVAGKHPQYAWSAVTVSIAGETAESLDANDQAHIEVTDLDPDAEYVVMNIAQSGDDPHPTFANTSNFIVRLAKRAGEDIVRKEFQEILDEYGTLEMSEFPIGTRPGLYSQEAVDAFVAAVDAAYGTDDMDPSEVTSELLIQLGQAVKDAYAAMIASKVMTYDVPSGYYRLRTAMIYTNEVPTGEVDADGNAITEPVDLYKYMLAEKSGTTLAAVWGNRDADDAEAQARALFQITATGEKTDNGALIYDIRSCYHQGRFNNVSTSAKVGMSTTSENLMAIEPAFTEEESDGGETYVNIRVSTQEPGYNYLHQGGHGSGSGTSGNVVGWNPSFTVDKGPAGTEWVLEPVDAAEAEAIMAAYEPIKARQEFEAAYVELRNNAVLALNKAKDYLVGDGVITDGEQFSSPFSQNDLGNADGGNLTDGVLIDGNASTYWHSVWSSGSVANHTHYLQVELPQTDYELLQMTITRRAAANDHITLWSVYGCNDEEAEDEEWTKLAVLETPFGNNTETVSAAPFEVRGYKYLRFYIDGTTTGRGYGHMSEFQLYQVSVNPTSQYVLMGEVSKNLDAVLREQENVTAADVTEEQAAALQAAYDAFILKYVDPAELRQVIADVEGIADGITIGQNPGYWISTAVADKLKDVVAEAREYDKAGIYVAETSNALIQRLNEEGEAVRAAAIGIQTGKWYRIRFGSEALYEEKGWDMTTGAAIVNSDEVETDEALWNKILTVADYKAEDGINYVVPMEAENIRIGDNIFFDEEGDITDPDMALFRFVAVGDSAYLIQNKASGLFLKAAGTSGSVTLSIHPTLFNAQAIGYGFNAIAARDLQGNKQNYLHAQRLYNVLVTWNDYTPGTRSALFIEEAGDVEADYDGSDFVMDINPGQYYAMCYPVNLSVGEEDGIMYTVNEAKGTTITLAPITTGAAAGRPFIYIYGETGDYDEDNDEVTTVTFKHGYDVAVQPDTLHALKGVFVSTEVGPGYIIPQGNIFATTRAFLGGSVSANSAYIAADEKVPVGSDITVNIDEDAVDGINTALRNVARTGVIYTIDGRVAARGNLNTVCRLPKGVYILNGTKVTVK